VVDSVEIDPIIYRKSIVASSFLRFPPYFYFRIGRKWLSATVFQPKCGLNVRRSLVDHVRAMWKIDRRPIIVLPVLMETGSSFLAWKWWPIDHYGGIGVEYGLEVDSPVAVMTTIFLLPVSSPTSFWRSECISRCRRDFRRRVHATLTTPSVNEVFSIWSVINPSIILHGMLVKLTGQ